MQPRKLITIVPTRLEHIRQRQMEPAVRARDLAGYFDTVYTIHPFATTDAMVRLDARNIIHEFSVTPLKLPSWARGLNYLLASLRTLKTLYALIRTEPIAAIRVQDPYVIGLYGVLLSMLTRKPLVVFVLSNYDLSYQATCTLGFAPLKFRWIEKRIERLVFGYAHAVWGGNDNNTAYAIANGARADKCATVRTIGICDHHFNPPAEPRLKRSDLGLADEKVLLFVGRLSPEKYPADVIRCAAIVARQHSNFKLLIAGDGVLRDRLEKLAEDLGVIDQVLFLGFRPQEMIQDLLGLADVVLSPLTGSSLVEAALAGACVVAYDVEWHSEIITDGVTGRLVPYRDITAMAGAVTELLADSRMVGQLGAQARARARAMFAKHAVQQVERRCFDRLLRQCKIQ